MFQSLLPLRTARSPGESRQSAGVAPVAPPRSPLPEPVPLAPSPARLPLQQSRQLVCQCDVRLSEVIRVVSGGDPDDAAATYYKASRRTSKSSPRN